MLPLKKFLNKFNYREGITYVLVGLTTTAVNLIIYQGLLFFNVDYKIANIFAVILCKVYGYFANKLIVFKSHCDNWKELLKELVRFIMARGFTGVVDYFGLIFVVEVCNCDKVISKYAISVLVIVLNYILGKKMVFNKNRKGKSCE